MIEKKDPSAKEEEGNLSELLKQMAATEKGGGAATGVPVAPKFDGRAPAATSSPDTPFLGKNSSGSGEFPAGQPAVAAQSRAAAGAGSAMANRPPTVQYIDDHNVREIFADGLNTVHFDGNTLRIEFGVTRAKRSDAPSSQVLERLPACRLVLSPQAIAELKNLMEKISSSAPQSPASTAGKEQK